MMRYPIILGLAAIVMLAVPLNLIAAQGSSGPSVVDENLEVEDIVEDLTLPTAMAFLDEETILVLEKDNGTVRVVEDGELQSDPLLDVAVANQGERGMLGIAASVENDTTTYVFLYYTESGGGADGDDVQGVEPAGNRLYRYELQNGELVNPKLLLDLPALPGPRYNGGPVVIGPDDLVYVTIGDGEGHTTQAQNFEDRAAVDGTSGVLRVDKNGEDPEPVIGTGAFGKYYYAYGIRNSFGMDFDPVSGMLWNTENGPASGDEINLVDAGFNSGWRDVFGFATDAQLAEEELVLFNAQSHYSNPEFTWIEPVGPTALEFLNSSGLGEGYENDMFVGDINNGALYHFDLNEERNGLALQGVLADTISNAPAENEGVTFGTGFGGITDVEAGPDGYLYVLSFGDGRIYRIFSDDATIANNDNNGSSDDNGSNNNDNNSSDDNDADVTINGLTVTLRDSATSIILRFAKLLDKDDCFNQQDRNRLANALTNILGDIYNDGNITQDRVDRVLDRITEYCLDGGSNQNRGRGNGNDNNGPGNGDGDD